MSYVLKARTQKEVLYYMNIICVTGQIDSAKHYNTEKEALLDEQHFRNLFFYETPEITVEKVEV